MKRLWFVQQKPFDYLPLRVGLGQIEIERLEDINFNLETKLCPKIYTSRKSLLKGEYVVVEGSRFKAKPVEPRIEFKVEESLQLDLKNELILTPAKLWVGIEYFTRKELEPRWPDLQNVHDLYPNLTFPELDLGYKGATFSELRNVLLNLNPTETSLATPFFINKMEPINSDRRLDGLLQEGELVSSQPPVTSPEVVA